MSAKYDVEVSVIVATYQDLAKKVKEYINSLNATLKIYDISYLPLGTGRVMAIIIHDKPA